MVDTLRVPKGRNDIPGIRDEIPNFYIYKFTIHSILVPRSLNSRR